MSANKYIYIAKFSLLAVIFALLQISYQLFLEIQELNFALVRGFAFAGATLIAFALLIGPISKFFPKLIFLFKHRRLFGVYGFIFAFLHALSVSAFYFNFNSSMIFYDLNPFSNPMIFGVLALSIFFLMFLTSNDLLQFKILGVKKWKALHRLVYFAFIFLVLHFVKINPQAVYTLPGYLLLLLTILVFIFELAAFFKLSKEKNFKSVGTFFGVIVIVFALVMLYLGFS